MLQKLLSLRKYPLKVVHYIVLAFKWVFVRPTRLIVRFVKAIPVNVWIVLLYAAVLAAAQFTLIWAPTVGIFLNILSLLVLTAGALRIERMRKLSISLAILPIVQMVSSTILTKNAFRTASIFYGVLLVLVLIYRYLFTLDEPVEKSHLRIKEYTFAVPLMLVIAEATGITGYGFLRHHYPYLHMSLPLVAVASVVFAFTEEMFLRGLVQQQAQKLVHPLVAAGLSSLIFASLTITHLTMLTIGPAIVTGVVLALVYYKKQNLVLCMVLNAFAKLTYIGLVATFILR